jgi:hypothetical protein
MQAAATVQLASMTPTAPPCAIAGMAKQQMDVNKNSTFQLRIVFLL